jgi:Fe-S-cluster containining protein
MPQNKRSDERLLQIVDNALAETAARSGAWLVCKAGCNQCCSGAFAVNELDAERLRAGQKELEGTDPDRARRVRERADAYVDRTRGSFPGDPGSGRLGEDEASQIAFEDFANEEVCPVLDTETGTCDLYAHRPMTCRVFGPPVRSQDGLGVCELCYVGASVEEIAACEMRPDPGNLESDLLADLRASGLDRGSSVVAYVLRSA